MSLASFIAPAGHTAAGGLELCVLASGSGGNCSVVRSSYGTILIDAGIGPRVSAKRLACLERSIGLDDIRAIVLTHLDHDHFNINWLPSLRKHGIPLYCHESRADELTDKLRSRGGRVEVRTFGDAAFSPVAGLSLEPIAFAHDAAGSHGFVAECDGTRLGYATDLGRVPEGLLERFCDLDLLAIESNYDRQMQLESPRPWFLKNRIMNGRGHLSNAEAFELVRGLFNRCEQRGARLPRHVVLLHRSRECNCPELLRRYFSRDARIARRLTLSEQHEPTGWLSTGPLAGEQMMLGWG